MRLKSIVCVMALAAVFGSVFLVPGSVRAANPDGKTPARFGVEEPGAWGERVDLEVWGKRT